MPWHLHKAWHVHENTPKLRSPLKTGLAHHCIPPLTGLLISFVLFHAQIADFGMARHLAKGRSHAETDKVGASSFLFSEEHLQKASPSASLIYPSAASSPSGSLTYSVMLW